MNYYFAPLHGITDYIYRNIVWKHFPCWDKLYAPFIQPNERPTIVPKEYQDICPENNSGIPTVPQILTCDAQGFIRVAKILEDIGYKEINLNLGCPANTVVSKGKGSAMLKDTNALNHFFDTIFQCEWNSKITVKTRLGFTDDDDFEDLLKVYCRYPIEELIIHPRFRSDWYNGNPRLDEFCKTFSLDVLPFKVCYNGNIYTTSDVSNILDKFPFLKSIMCGRGALSNPSLIRELKGGNAMTLEEFIAFHDDIFNTYMSVMPRERNLINKMMQMWTYWSTYWKPDKELLDELRRCVSVKEYTSVIWHIYESL